MSGLNTFIRVARLIGADATNTGYSQGATQRWSLLNRAKVSGLFAKGVTPTFAQLTGAIRRNAEGDCSSSAFAAAWLAYNGVIDITGTAYTGNLHTKFKASGLFKVLNYNPKRTVKAQTRAGDLLLTPGKHVVIVLDKGQVLNFVANEKGRTTGGKPGDQTGREVRIQPLYVRPGGWRYIVRPIRAAEFAGRILAAVSKGSNPARTLDLMRISAPFDGPRWTETVQVWRTVFGGLPLHYTGEYEPLAVQKPTDLFPHAFVILGATRAKMTRRVKAALPAILAHPASVVVVSGGVKRDGKTEAAIMRDQLVAGGVPAGRIVLEQGSGSTVGNANKTLPLLQTRQVRSVTLVSDASHLRRALLDFTAAQLRIETATNKRLGITWLQPIAHNDYGTNPVKTEAAISAKDRAAMVSEVAVVLGLSAQLKANL